MDYSIGQLAAIESMLGYNFNYNAPSLLNNYCMYSSSYNPFSYPYYNPSFCGGSYYSDWMNNGYNTGFGMVPQNSQNNQVAQTQNPNFESLSKEDVKALSDYYSRGINAEEGFGGALLGAIPFAMMENPQTIAHPINAIKAAKKSGVVMESMVKRYGLEELRKANPEVFDGAYKQLYRVCRNSMWKLPTSRWFVQGMVKGNKVIKGNVKECKQAYKSLLEIMDEAMRNAKASKDVKEIRIATEQLRAASANNGRLPRVWKRIRTLGKYELETPVQLAKKSLSSGAAKEAAEKAANGFVKNLTVKGAAGNAALMIAFEALADKDKIGAAFRQDRKTGWKQVGQTSVKGITTAAGLSIGGAAGKAAGAWAGAWAGAKVGALVGSAVPGLGTAVGAVVGTLIGFAGMSVGMWLGGKLAKGIVGKDVGQTALENEKRTTTEGQAELIEYAYKQKQAGEKLDARTQQALDRALMVYGIAS